MKNRSVYSGIFLFLLLLVISASTLHAQRGRYHSSWRYYPVGGQRFYSLPHSYLQLSFGGSPYYYASGLFYQPFGGYYQVVAPPFGIHVSVLPTGYWPLALGGLSYYYFNGIFYQRNSAYNYYEVVHAPVGAEVPEIPRDARAVVIDGEKFYESNGSFFKESIRPNGEIWYRVAGKNGMLNTAKNNPPVGQDQPQSSSQPPVTTDTKPVIGEVFDKLPGDCKTVVINSKKFYVSADNVYYEELIDGNQLRYKVAGK